MRLHFHDLSQQVAPDMVTRVTQGAREAFGFDEEQMSHCREWIQGTLTRAHLLVVVEDFHACMFASIPERRLDGRRFLWGDGGYVRPGLQNRQIMKLTFMKTLEHLGMDQFGWIGGRTQNIYALRGLQRLGFTRPVDGSYLDEEGQRITEFLASEIEQVNGLAGFEPASGICRKAFFASLVSDETSVAHHIRDISPDDGDALICVTRLDARR